jgi:thiol-disulfide isomerase/thioredoxin
MLALLSWAALAACSGADERAESASATPAIEAPEPAVPAEPEWIEVDAESVATRLRAHPAPFLLVNVWSTWCEPCVEEMPILVRVAREHEARGLGLVLLSADPRSQRDAARALLREHGAPLPGWIKTGSDDAFVRALHPAWSGALPATLLLDRERRVVRFFPEQVGEDELRAAIGALVGGDA